jgi:hypothetical protein
MKIDITAEHEGVTKTICTYEFEPIVGQSEDVTTQVLDAINSNISFFMMGLHRFDRATSTCVDSTVGDDRKSSKKRKCK